MPSVSQNANSLTLKEFSDLYGGPVTLGEKLICASAEGPVDESNGALLLQNEAFAATADAPTDVITAENHGLLDGEAVFITGLGSPPDPLVAGTRYYVRDATAGTFKVSATRDGSAINLTADGGAATFDMTTNYGVDRVGSFILGRGNLQTTTSNDGSSLSILGNENTIAWLGLPETYAYRNEVAKSAIIGNNNTVSNAGQGWFLIAGYSNAVQVGATGATTIVLGDQHIGGGHSVFFGGGFHNLANTVGTTNLAGAALGVVGSGTILVGAGGVNMQLFGAGVHAYWQGFTFHSSHCNKDAARFSGTMIYKSATEAASLASGATRTNELFTMDYSYTAMVDCATGVDTGTDIFTTRQNMSGIAAMQDDSPVWVGCNGTLPTGLVQDTLYYLDRLTATTFKLKSSAGGAAVNITGVGSGQLFIQPQSGNVRWLRLFPNKLYSFEIECKVLLRAATTPVFAIFRRRVLLQTGANNTVPTTLELVASALDIGSDGGMPPVGWALDVTTNTGGLHLSVTVKNTDVATRDFVAYAKVDGSEVNLS